MTERVLLVGESNPYGADPRYALYPRPRGSAGGRLCALLKMQPAEYRRVFDRVNLLTGPVSAWSTPKARLAAEALTSRYRVLLGARVAEAHGFDFYPFRSVDAAWGRGLILPHPSGRSRLWTEAGAAERARLLILDMSKLAFARRTR